LSKKTAKFSKDAQGKIMLLACVIARAQLFSVLWVLRRTS